MMGKLDRVAGRLYDTVAFEKGQFLKKVLFQTPVGQQGKTHDDTNMVMGGCLPAPQRFIAKRLRVEILSGSLADIEWLKLFGRVDLLIGCKPYWTGPISSLLLEDWLRKAVSRIGEDQSKQLSIYLDDALANGNLSLGTVDRHGVVIETMEAFQVYVRTESDFELSEPLAFRMFIEGDLFRAVQ